MDQESTQIIINHCPECSQGVDVTALAPYSKIICPHCQVAVRIRTRLGQYQIKGPLGEGGMSRVFVAEDITLGREVALKILHQELSLDRKLTEMFEREAKLTASINHPNVVKVYTVGSENGYFYIAMELLEAISVEQIIAENGALPEREVLDIAYDVVAGLKAAYQNKLIHRDIKPGNMLVTKDGTAKLVDFGLAVAQGGADVNEDLWATPFYVPPEKLVREPDTYLGDIYALGATCYHALAGQPPFLANTSSLEELIAIKSVNVDLKSVAPSATTATVKLFEQMMAYSPSDRPASYDILLEKIQARRNDVGAPPKVNLHSVKTKRKGTLLKVFLGFGACLLMIVFLFFRTNGKKDQSDLNSLLTSAGDRVISPEEREAAGKMLAGRRAMVSGQLNEARKIFGELEGNKNFTQPSMAWNTFNQGLVELLIGNEKSARTAFAALKSQKGFEPSQKPYERFFDRISVVLSNPLPVLRSDLVVDSTSFESIGLLAAALKNWEQEQYSEANRFFEDFLKVESPSTDLWIGDMKSVVSKYQADLALLESLPNPSQQMDSKTLEDAKAKLETADQKLQTRGSMKKLLKSRIIRAENFISNARPPTPPATVEPPSPLATEWTDAEMADVAHIQTVVSSFPDFKNSYVFSGAVLKLEATTPNTPKGKALRQDLIDGCKAANIFLESLTARLNLGSYKGIIERKQGVKLDAAITAASPTTINLDLGFGGPNEVEIDEFAPSWFIDAAEQCLGEPSPNNLKIYKEAFWFSTLCGFSSQANRIAAKIITIDKKFKEDGQRFRKINFNQSVTTN